MPNIILKMSTPSPKQNMFFFFGIKIMLTNGPKDEQWCSGRVPDFRAGGSGFESPIYHILFLCVLEDT
jgi:hypothetical protein